ncbi:MAG: hypothetical protein GOMPHAMPRED_006113 [Gomphillus americanus]|uniref:HOOK N-terminal domain-containing protein n=1 Tax=Gomphillus americanus TaxID=1940652 RepID=A0A8H3HYY1_9LECA|nr:MAG: hypothetical protein GOMPHAMPRED_006113 [Gomphillus americanus]
MSTKAHVGSKKLSVEGQALLEWFKAIAQPSAVLDIEDLIDGQLVWNILQRIRPDEFTSPLPNKGARNTNNWVSNWQNLKHICKYLTNYITKEVGRLPPSLDGLDLQALAKNDDIQAVTQVRNSVHKGGEVTDCALQLLKMVLFVAVNADENAPYISPMYALGNDQQKLVQQTILEVRSWKTLDDRSSNGLEMQGIADLDEKDGETRSDSIGDKDLYFEEQLARLSRENENLARAKNDLLISLREQTERNARLTQNNSSLQDKLSSLQGKLDETSGTSIRGSVLKDLEAKVKDQEDHIAFQETQLTDLQKQNDDFRRDVTRLREMETRFQPLQDSVDELRTERDILTRKANAIDKYKARLQTLADLEKENESLRSAIDELREVNKDGNQARESAKAFQRQIDEMSRMIPTIEQELFESRMMKQQLDANAQDLRKQLESANSRYEQDQNTIRDLLEQVQAGAPQPGVSDSLDNELDDDTKPLTKTKKESVVNMLNDASELSTSNRYSDYQEAHETVQAALNEEKIRNKALEGMYAAAKLRIKKLETTIEEGYASKSNTGSFIGLLPETPSPTTDTDMVLRTNTQEAIELQQERNAIGQGNTDSGMSLVQVFDKCIDMDKVALIDKDELQRMRNYEASALEADDLRMQNQELRNHVTYLQDGSRDMTAGSGFENTVNVQKKVSDCVVAPPEASQPACGNIPSCLSGSPYPSPKVSNRSIPPGIAYISGQAKEGQDRRGLSPGETIFPYTSRSASKVPPTPSPKEKSWTLSSLNPFHR